MTKNLKIDSKKNRNLRKSVKLEKDYIQKVKLKNKITNPLILDTNKKTLLKSLKIDSKKSGNLQKNVKLEKSYIQKVKLKNKITSPLIADTNKKTLLKSLKTDSKKSGNLQKNVKLEKSYIQKVKLKNKITNHLMISGNKRTCEKTLLQCLKTFQKTSLKNYRETIQLAIINTTPVFLLKEIKKLKKRKRKEIIIPFIPKEDTRISYSIKNIILETLKKKFLTKKSYKILMEELSLNAKKKSESVVKKNETQEEAIKRKKQLARFRWF